MVSGEGHRLHRTVYGQRDVTVLDDDGRLTERPALQAPAILVAEVSVGAVERLVSPYLGLSLNHPILSR